MNPSKRNTFDPSSYPGSTRVGGSVKQATPPKAARTKGKASGLAHRVNERAYRIRNKQWSKTKMNIKYKLATAKSELLEALRRAERDVAPKRVIRKLEKLIGDLETLQHTV